MAKDAQTIENQRTGPTNRSTRSCPSRPLRVNFAFGEDMTNIEDDFKNELLRAVDICINLYRYRPSYFLQMLDSYGAVGTATKLVTAAKFHEGFTKLWEFWRLDLTVEAIMRRSPYHQLFPREVLDKALERLKALGYEE